MNLHPRPREWSRGIYGDAVPASSPRPAGAANRANFMDEKGIMPRKKRQPPATLTMSMAEYQALAGVNWSALKYLGKSPLHFAHHRAQGRADTASMLAGRAAHTAVLEPDRFPIDYAVWTGAARRGAEWEAFRDAHPGRTILKVDEYQEALAIRDAVRGHKVADRILTGGAAERVLIWTDPDTGIACKCRIDWLRADGFADLKTTRDLTRRRFRSQAHDLGYHGQLAFYRRGCLALGLDPTVWLVAVEGAPPHDVAAFAVDPGVIATGDEEVGRLLVLLKECERTKKWPGRYPDLETFHLPPYAYGDDEESGNMGLTIGGAA